MWTNGLVIIDIGDIGVPISCLDLSHLLKEPPETGNWTVLVLSHPESEAPASASVTVPRIARLFITLPFAVTIAVKPISCSWDHPGIEKQDWRILYLDILAGLL